MISVIIPIYNAEKTVVKALDSVKNQSWNGDFEIIAINDGSTDRSREIVENYRQRNPEMNVILVNQENGGVSKARNTGLSKSSGDFIAFLDADDEWLPEKTERQMKILLNPNLNADFVASLWNNEEVVYPYIIDPTNRVVEITLKKLLIKITGQTSTAIFKREVLENTGQFDENQRYSEDANLWMRISANNKMYLLPKKLVIAGGGKKSFGAAGLSANLKEMEKGIQKNLREMYEAKRINYTEYIFYFVFSKFKYFLRPLRAKI
ncbi:glycosyltransferase family A protein [Chryseobacterium sp. HSC-36S06]|uniref:glycosyltransferase family 2 protein n=1 Tax=Chryseobacterium sp. HSC-36S06 TaxID=2910970 RepID=UPI00209CF4E7|nr:glycosyltransferase involved in cell wall biosynthesis [Chryseobacterium sp. HSC-36S06]